MSFFRQSSQTFFARIYVFIFSFLIALLVARVLGPEGKGIYALLTLVPVFVIQLTNLGLGISSVYYLGKKLAPPKALAENAFSTGLFLGLLLFIIFWLGRHFLAPVLYKNISLPLVLVAMTALPFLMLYQYVSHLLLAVTRIREYNISLAIKPTILVVFLIFFWTVLQDDYLGALLAWLLSDIIGTILSLFFLYQEINFRLKFHLHLFWQTLPFGLKGYLANVLYLINYRLDLLLVNYFLTQAMVGYYSVSIQIAETLWFLPSTLAMLLLPRVAAGEEKQSDALTCKTCRIILAISVISAIAIFLVGRTLIVVLFGRAFLPALYPLWLLLPGVIVYSGAKILSSSLTGKGYPQIVFYVSLVSLLTNFLLDLWLIPRWETLGAAFASSCANMVASVFFVLQFKAKSGCSIYEILWLQVEDINYMKHHLNNFRNSIRKK